MWNHEKRTEDIVFVFDYSKQINNDESPDYLNIPIDETYLNMILKSNMINRNILFPIKIKSNNSVIMIVTTTEFCIHYIVNRLMF